MPMTAPSMALKHTQKLSLRCLHCIQRSRNIKACLSLSGRNVGVGSSRSDALDLRMTVNLLSSLTSGASTGNPVLSARYRHSVCAGSSLNQDLGDPLAEQETGKRFKLRELEVPGTVLTGTNAIGSQVYDAAQKAITLLKESDAIDLAIFSFGFEASQGKVYLRLDKLDNKYGSPTLDEINIFSRKYGQILAEDLGEAVSDDIEFEVSSPGAEREIRVPQELERFSDLPLCVELEKDLFVLEGVEIKKSKNDMHSTMKVIMTVCRIDWDNSTVTLKPVKSKTNENTFGRKTWNRILKSGKMLSIEFDQVTRVNLHLEI